MPREYTTPPEIRDWAWVVVQRFRKAASALEYAADLTPVVAAKEASASWNARGMAETA